MRSRRARRLHVGVAVFATAALLSGLTAGSAAAVASPTVTPGGSGAPLAANLSSTTFDLGTVGYQSSEYFLTGNASSYHDVATHAASTITNVAVTSNVVTITTSADHGIAVGDVVTITGLSHTALNRSQVIVTSVPSTTTFTFSFTTPAVASVADSGTVTPNLTANGAWTVEADATQQPFKTRVQVYRPTNAATFNGTVYVEWLNVTNQADSAADWILAHDEILRTGAVYVGVTAQAVGVTAARNTEPARYGAAGANLVHPGDSFSYDIFSQAGQAIRDNQDTILGGLSLGKLIALGESQSASRMVTYIDAVGVADHVYDGYFVHSRGNAAALRAAALGAVNGPANALIRTDIGVPVFTIQTETDSRTIRQPDSNVFRDWEIAGSAHASMYTLGIGQVDTGTTNTAAVQLFQRMLQPTNEPLPGVLPACNSPVNAGPDHWSIQAGLHALREWVTNGAAPAPSLYQSTAGGVPSAAVLLDGNGNVQGGVRNPHVDVPVATLRGVGQSGNLFCSLFGTTTPFSAEKINGLYSSHADFVTKWNQSVDDQVSLGYLLAADAPFLKFSAADSNVGLRIPGTPSVTGVVAADSALSVSFSPPGIDADKVTGYTATCSDSGSSTLSASGTESPIVVGALTDGTAYTCAVHATNAIGDGAESDASSATVAGIAPVVTLTRPADDAIFSLHQLVTADYSCTDDGGAGLATCNGPAADDDPIDTNSVGAKTFTVSATDQAGNASSLTNDYKVRYVFAFRPPFDKKACVAFSPGSPQTVTFELSDALGAKVSTGSATLTLAKMTNGTAGAEFPAVPQKGSGNTFTNGIKPGEYTFDLKTKDLDKATYRLTITTNDGEQYVAQISADKAGCPK